ncbi:MAG: hypothetical protein K2Z81_22735 [Cyanobacteria bacterium]|nr:hypothetical protein [Cyanobacteriota bacterium]
MQSKLHLSCFIMRVTIVVQTTQSNEGLEKFVVFEETLTLRTEASNFSNIHIYNIT